MVTMTQYPFQVWDENGKEVDSLDRFSFLHKNDLVVLTLKGHSFKNQGPIGLFQGIEENVDDGHADYSHTDVILRMADRIACYDMRRLQTKVDHFRVEDIKLIQLLARNSSAASILFELIGEAHARNGDLTARIKNAVTALDVLTQGGNIILR